VEALWVVFKEEHKMINSFSQSRILGAVVLLLVSGSVVLAAIDPSTRSIFLDLTKFVVGAYIGRTFAHQTKHNNSDRPSQ
jgi:hypothetical protein